MVAPVKVREIIKLIEDDGWYLVRTRGSHRQYKHATKSGLVTIAGSSQDDLAPGTLNSILEASGVEEMKYLIIVETTGTGYSAYSPDLDGCIATGATREEVERAMREAIEFHLEGLRADGQQVPIPQAYATYVETAA
jgi:predicted RNA binding protein YcfA (HicA-like mRNA interferase family)/predicted RNase H-like HicB family nuclease